MITFQEVILRLQEYWNRQGCALLQPIDLEVGAGTSHTATFLRALGPEPWRAAYVQPSRRPKDARYGENPNRLHQHHQYQVVLKPAPTNIVDLYLGSLRALGIDTEVNDIRFVEDNWENPTLGAWGLGWEVWMNGMEVTQFTYFQQVGGLECKPITGEITYGLERLTMYLQNCDNVFDLVYTTWKDPDGTDRVLTYGDVFHQNEVEQSHYNFEASDCTKLLQQFDYFESEAKRLMDLGLGYLTLDRSASTLSTGERQRMQLARAVRNRTTGVLYVLDEPSIGLHPSNIVGLTGVMHDLVADGNSVILVDHDTQILKEADWIVEMGPEAGAKGGYVIAQGAIPAIEANSASQIGPFLAGTAETKLRCCTEKETLFANGTIHLSTDSIHTVKPLDVDIPKGRLTVVTGVSGSGKTTMVLESLIPALEATIAGSALPAHIRAVSADGIAHVKLIDATPIGINVRSTVATYAGAHDELRKLYAKSPDAKARGYKAGDFSYNTGSLRCPGCDGTGIVSLDVQFLPDVDIPCPDCHGSRYARAAEAVRLTNGAGESASLPELMDMDVNSALEFCRDRKTVSQRLAVLRQLGLGYLTLGEETPSLSGGEAQRLKLASEIGRTQTDSVFVFDEPSIGLHPLDVRVLLGVFQALLDNGATVIVIEHDLDVIRNADYVIDMGPGGGDAGGRIVASGTPQEIRENQASITGRYL